MYRTQRRSAAGIANFCRYQDDDTPDNLQSPLDRDGEAYKPIYYPLNPAKQANCESSSDGLTPTWPSANGGEYAKSDGYRSLMAFNSQQRIAGKVVKRDKSEEPIYKNDNDLHGHGTPKMVSLP